MKLLHNLSFFFPFWSHFFDRIERMGGRKNKSNCVSAHSWGVKWMEMRGRTRREKRDKEG